MSQSEQRADRAKVDLFHYFTRAGIEETSDTQAEIEEIVDCIIDAAVLCVVENHLKGENCKVPGTLQSDAIQSADERVGKVLSTLPSDDTRSPQQIVDECDQLASELARAEGWEMGEREHFHSSKNPHALLFFRRAALAMEILQQTSVDDALSELE